MAKSREEYRRRIIVFTTVLVGIFLLAGALVLYVEYASQEQPTEKEVQPLTSKDKMELSQLLKKILYLLGLILIIFFFGLWAIVRWSRRFRQFLLREPPEATPVEDVWAMHRLPDETDTFEPGDQDEPGQNEQE